MFNQLLSKIRNAFKKCVIKTKNALLEKPWLKWVAVGVAAVLIGVIVLCSLTMCKGNKNSAASSVPDSSSSVEVSESIEDTESSVLDSESASEPESSESEDSSSSEEFVIPEIPEVPAADQKKGSTSDFEYEFSEELNGLILLSIGDYSAPTLEIPSTIIEYDDEGNISVKMVVAIGDSAIFGYNTLKVVIIPNTIREIGDGAFEGCLNLHRVEIGEMVSYIGLDAFKGCTNLKTVLFPSYEGWFVSGSGSGNKKDGIELTYEEIVHHENVANLLKGDYCHLYWLREVY